jgi:hypothetical protein
MYVYEHVNGTYHYIKDFVVRSIGSKTYFKSKFVKHYWHFNSKEEAEKFVKQRQEETERIDKGEFWA